MDSLKLISALLDLLISKYSRGTDNNFSINPEVLEQIIEFLRQSSNGHTKQGFKPEMSNSSIKSGQMPAQEHFGSFDFNFLNKGEKSGLHQKKSTEQPKEIMQKGTPTSIKDLPNSFKDFNFDL